MTESTLLGAIAGTPWAMLPAALQTLVEVASRDAVEPANRDRWKALMAPAAAVAERQAVAFREAQPLPGAARAQLRGSVAILEVAGPIFRHANLFTEISGATAIGTLARDLQLAADDPRVTAILLNIDSPGGQLNGLTELGEAIRAAAGRKPVTAYVDGVAASAAYLLAAAAHEVVMARSATVGSLGVVGIFPPQGSASQQPVEIVSSQTPNKRASPHTDAGRARLQAWIDASAQVFLDTVASFRGMAVEALLEATDGGGLLVGQAAVTAGLADRLGSFEDTLARLAGGARPAMPRPGRRAETAAEPLMTAGGPMADPTTPAPEPVATPVAEAPPASVPIVAATPAAETPLHDPVLRERERVSAILAAAQPGMLALVQLAVSKAWAPEDFVAAQEASGAAVASARRDAFAASMPAPVATAPAPDLASLPPAERAAAEWAASEALRAEFTTLGAYQAFVKAKAEGRVRLLTRPNAA
jgi:ClpP class serine protease